MSPTTKVEFPKPTTTPATSVSIFPRVSSQSPPKLPPINTFQNLTKPFNSKPPSLAPSDSARSTISTIRPPVTNTLPRKSGFISREPRIQTESTRDLADFIRSTGPARLQEISLPFLTTNFSNPSLPATAEASPVSKWSYHAPTIKGDAPSVRSSRLQKRGGAGGSAAGSAAAGMEPRGGAVMSSAATSSGTSDLIDFIRQGPPPHDGGHRIPRAVAPFRNTMDSDMMDRLINGRSPEETPQASSTSLVLPSRPAPSSTSTAAGSRASSFLAAQPTVQPAYSGTPPRLTEPGGGLGGSFSGIGFSGMLGGVAAPPQPQAMRMRRRVKDPYAIDSDEEDEDDDMLTALPSSRPGRMEESLIDFLRNTEPPDGNSSSSSSAPLPLPFLIGPGAPNGGGPMRLRSSNSMLAARNGPVSAAPTTLAPSGRAPTVRSASITSSTSPSISLPKLAGARDARTAKAGDHHLTRDLADFLRSSGPPEPVVRDAQQQQPAVPSPVPPPPAEKQSGSLGKSRGRWWRKKASSADMS